MTKKLAAAASLLWVFFGITLTIRLMAGSGSLLTAEMLRFAPPEKTGLPAEEYPGVGRMTAAYLTGKEDSFQYTYTDASGQEILCFQAHEAFHMADCRGLIRLDAWVCLVCGGAAAGLTAAGLYRRKNREDFYRGILAGLRIFAAVAAALLIWALLNFDGLFITFHRVAFRNDGWLLDSRTDLLIRLMPQSFFISLGIRGGMFALAGPILLEAVARLGLYQQKKRNLI